MITLTGIDPMLMVFPIIFGLSAGTMTFALLRQGGHPGRPGQGPLTMHRGQPGRLAFAVLPTDNRR